MLTLVVQILAQVVAVPLVVLLVRRAASRRQPIASTAAAVQLAAYAVGSWDPAGSSEVFNGTTNAVAWIAAVVLLATFPDGRFTPRWTIAPVAGEVIVQLGNIVSGFRWDDLPLWWTHYLLTAVVLLFGGQLYRYVRRSTVEERRQVGWPLLTLLTQIVTYTVLYSLLVALTGAASGDLALALSVALNGLFPLGFTVGLLAPFLFPVDRALRAVIAVSIVALVLLALVGATLALLPALHVPPAPLPWWCALIVALATPALLHAARRVSDLAVYRGRADPLRTLTELGDRLDHGVDPMTVPSTIVRAVVETLGLEGAVLRADGVLGAEYGDLRRSSRSFPVVYQGERLAVLGVAPRQGDAELSDHDRLVVGHLARQAASALHGTRVMMQLIEARARLVLAREEERRRLRRDLHDDLAPTFAGLGLGAAAIQEFARARDDRAAQAATELLEGIRSATRQIREIAYDLRPPVLDDQGLVAAVRDRVETLHGVPVVRVEGPLERLELPAAVESAALRIVQEAVMNVRRHAAAASCVVSIEPDGPNALLLEITDDGCGIPAVYRDGVGLGSMRERAEELAGSCRITSTPEGGGTRVSVRLPLHLPRIEGA